MRKDINDAATPSEHPSPLKLHQPLRSLVKFRIVERIIAGSGVVGITLGLVSVALGSIPGITTYLCDFFKSRGRGETTANPFVAVGRT
eukprot:scaffold107667_cov50-Attheya_sp.AAC.1